MESELLQNRSNRRLTPRKPVTVAVQAGESSLAYGVVTNISETGACVMTDSSVGQGRIVLLRMSFYRHADLFETAARVVWSGEETDSPHGVPHAVLQGVQFTELADRELSRLRKLLDSPDFVPGAVLSVTPEFEDLVSALRQDLGKLGTKLRRVTDSDAE
jgi:hypothetical protein